MASILENSFALRLSTLFTFLLFYTHPISTSKLYLFLFLNLVFSFREIAFIAFMSYSSFILLPLF